MPKKCPACGKINKETDEVCVSCGVELPSNDDLGVAPAAGATIAGIQSFGGVTGEALISGGVVKPPSAPAGPPKSPAAPKEPPQSPAAPKGPPERPKA